MGLGEEEEGRGLWGGGKGVWRRVLGEEGRIEVWVRWEEEGRGYGVRWEGGMGLGGKGVWG